MNAKLIRTEYVNPSSEYHNVYMKKYIFECSECGKEYMKWVYNKRTACICPECHQKRNYAQTKAREQRKQQERINKVLEDIKADIIRHSKICDPEFKDAFEVTVQIIDKYIGGKK